MVGDRANYLALKNLLVLFTKILGATTTLGLFLKKLGVLKAGLPVLLPILTRL